MIEIVNNFSFDIYLTRVIRNKAVTLTYNSLNVIIQNRKTVIKCICV